MMNNIVMSNIGQHVSDTTPLTLIAIFQVLRSVLFYTPQLELDEQENMGVMQQGFVQCTKDCDNMGEMPHMKLIFLGLASITLLPISALHVSILLAET